MFKYQIHTHTAPTSKCARTSPAELAQALHEGGYSGCVVTNHFYHGNTGVSRDLSWEEFVAPYERDYLECKRAGEQYGLDIIFGIEEGVENNAEILCYGVTPELLYSHPELRECNNELWCKVMRENGVVVIQAHPYRSGRHPLPLELIDGIEVYNHSHSPEYNDSAEIFAAEHPELILTSGADTHFMHDVAFAGIESQEPIRNGKDLVRILKERKYQLIKS